MIRFLAAIALLAIAAPAAAQGCTSESPCPLELTVDDRGFSDQTEWNVTMGDVYSVSLFNLDGESAHTVTLSGYGTSLTAESYEDAAATVTFDQAGDFFFMDDQTGDEAVVHVLEGVDAAAFEDGLGSTATTTTQAATTTTSDGDTDADTPGVPLAVLAVLVGALAVAMRRRMRA